ncbi:MAG: TRAP transporter small permease [Enterococcus sp.]
MNKPDLRIKLNRFLLTLCAIILALMAIFANWQVIGRYVFSDPPGWTDETLRFMLIWLTMIGAPLAHGLNRSMVVTFLVDKMAEKSKIINTIFVESLIILFSSIVLIVGGIIYCTIGMNVISSSLGIRMVWVYASLPVSGVLFIIYSSLKIKEALLDLKLLKEGGDENG